MSQEIAPTDAAGNCGKHSWRPIETAPRDGTDILAYTQGTTEEAFVVFWDEGHWMLFGQWGDPGTIEIDGLTHWMPLPEPPV